MKTKYMQSAYALACAAWLAAIHPAAALAAQPALDQAVPQRLLIDTSSPTAHASLRASLEQQGMQVVSDHPGLNFMVVQTAQTGTASARSALAGLRADSRVARVAHDRVKRLINPQMQREMFGTAPFRKKLAALGAGQAAARVAADPALGLAGLMWNAQRIHAQQAWNQALGLGYQFIKVGVADTGLDYTHAELADKVDGVVDFTVNEQPNLCAYYGYPTDADLAKTLGASADLDFHGHGSWIGGNIAAALDGSGINGIAPGVQLVSLKIAQNCGYAYDSEILNAFAYAADHGIDVVSISFGGYLDRTDPEQDLLYGFYQRVVDYAWSRGTLIVAAAGNEHARIGMGGQVLSHGILDAPPGGTDYYGLWETPGGIPGVVMVSSTGNVVNGPADTCPADSLANGNHQWCKLKTDAHQPSGVGRKNQLAYYSNYGPRIDFAAPGGARKFNLPAIDNGGTEGWPWTGQGSMAGGSSVADGYNAWEVFSITSNYAQDIPCFTISGTVFPEKQCYGVIQGTSMATPHVSAVAALALSTHPAAWKDPAAVVSLLRAGAVPIANNRTRALSATDTSPGDLGGKACTYGYCHLGKQVISDLEAYGAGLIDAYGSVVQPR